MRRLSAAADRRLRRPRARHLVTPLASAASTPVPAFLDVDEATVVEGEIADHLPRAAIVRPSLDEHRTRHLDAFAYADRHELGGRGSIGRLAAERVNVRERLAGADEARAAPP